MDPIILADVLVSDECRQRNPKGFGQIYMIKPLVSARNNVGYIGQNKSCLYERVMTHKGPNSKCPALKNALAAHGLNKFTIEVIEERVYLDELNEREAYWIKKHDTYKNGLNCTPGGESGPCSVPEISAKQAKVRWAGDAKAVFAEQKRQMWKDKGAEIKANMKRAHARPAEKARRAQKSRETAANPVFRAKKSATLKAMWEPGVGKIWLARMGKKK